jgi:hypothetical protein
MFALLSSARKYDEKLAMSRKLLSVISRMTLLGARRMSPDLGRNLCHLKKGDSLLRYA